ncbi:MAG TPA: GDSL-type esterase/lipase family protein [Thermoanaerobaculia bacterium]|nr:GDSL-type esterase/lipase family protein [Thermoanaerobaculia bacterium]
MSPVSHPRRIGKLALLTGTSLAAGLLASELALRVAGFSFHLRPERIDFGWPRSLASLGSEYRPDPELLWVRSDYEQRLDRARAERPAIAFLGDSCTDFGRYPDLLLQELSRKRPGTRWTGVNLGTAGWSTFQGLRQLERDVLPLRPRILTVYYGWNDHWIGFGLPDEEVAKLLQETGSGWGDLRLVQLGEKAWIGAHRSDDSRRVPLPEFRRNLHEIVRLARGAGIEPVLITAPTAHRRGREPRFLQGRWLKRLEDLVPLHQQYVEAARDVGRQDGAVVCDLARDFAALGGIRRDVLFLKDGIHLNAKGSQKAARLLAGCLESSGVLDRARP